MPPTQASDENTVTAAPTVSKQAQTYRPQPLSISPHGVMDTAAMMMRRCTRTKRPSFVDLKNVSSSTLDASRPVVSNAYLPSQQFPLPVLPPLLKAITPSRAAGKKGQQQQAEKSHGAQPSAVQLLMLEHSPSVVAPCALACEGPSGVVEGNSANVTVGQTASEGDSHAKIAAVATSIPIRVRIAKKASISSKKRLAPVSKKSSSVACPAKQKTIRRTSKSKKLPKKANADREVVKTEKDMARQGKSKEIDGPKGEVSKRRRTAVPTSVSTGHTRHPQSKDRVEIMWEDRDIAFVGTLQCRHGKRSWMFDVFYDDGDELVEDMDNVYWRFLPDGAWVEPGDLGQRSRDEGDHSFFGTKRRRSSEGASDAGGTTRRSGASSTGAL